MKFGYCVNMIAQDDHGIGYEQLPMLKRVGFDYVELPLAQIMTMGDRAFRTGPLAALDSTGLPCLACNNFFPASYHLTGPQVDADSILAYANAALDRAAVMGAKRVVFGSACARNMPLGFSAAEATEQPRPAPDLADTAAPASLGAEALTMEEQLILEHEGQAALFEMGEVIPDAPESPSVTIPEQPEPDKDGKQATRPGKDDPGPAPTGKVVDFAASVRRRVKPSPR